MATGNKRLIIDIQIDADAFDTNTPNQINSGDKITYQINQNFEPLGYDTSPSFVEKTFIRPDIVDADNIFDLTEGEPSNLIGETNGQVRDIEYFFYNEEGIKIISIVGQFTTYTKDGTTTNCNGFIILNDDGTVYKRDTAPYDIIDTSNATVETVRHHEINDTLLIGGNFTSVGGNNDIQYFFEYSLDEEFFTNRTINYATAETNGTVKDIDVLQRTGIIFIGGEFNTFMGITSRMAVAMNQNFTIPDNNLYTNFRTNINNIAQASVNKIEVKQTGDLKVAVGGNFITDDRQNFFLTDNIGNVDLRFESITGGVPLTIVLRNTTFYIGGTFNKYGTLEVNKGVKLNINLHSAQDLGFEDNYGIRTLEFGEFDSLYVGFAPIGQNYNLVKFNVNNQEVTQKISVNSQINTLKYLEDKMVVGGNFSSYNFETTDLNNNEILVAPTLLVTRNNILNNLVENNNREADTGFRYSIIANDIIRLTKIIENEDDLFYVSNIKSLQNKVSINIIRNDSNIEDLIRSVPVRREYILTSPARSEWSTAEFKVGETTISKPRIADEQISQYLNISSILKDNSFEADVDYFNRLDFGGITPVINKSRLGNFVSVVSNTLLNNINLGDNSFIGYTHDGYNETDTILLNGRKRAITNRLAIPFLTSRVQNIQFRYKDGGNQNIINSNFANINPENATGYVSYLNMNNIGIRDFVDIDFRNNNDGVLDTVRVYNRESKCLYEPVEVIFKNSFGMLEIIEMIGNSVEDISVESSTIKRNNRDINGRIGLQSKHTNKVYNKTGEKKWELNVGYIPDYVNSVLEDLIMSEEVWLKKDGIIIPVVMEGNGFSKVTDIQDLNNYSFNFREDRKITE
jgi:hypothetical protein